MAKDCPRRHGRLEVRRLCLALLLIAGAGPAAAQPVTAADYAWNPHPGAAVPLETPFRDDRGAATTLGAAFDGKPVVLDLGYHRCPTLCGPVRADLLHALRGTGLPDDAYRLVVLSIDPAETPDAAAAARASDAAAPGWRYLTGTAPAIAAVSGAVGFRSHWDRNLQQFLHPAGAVVLTPDGRVSDTLLGLGFTGSVMRDSLLRAASGGIAAPPSPIVLLCFHFDQLTGRYSLAIEKVLRLMAVFTVLTLGGTLWVMHRR